MTDKPKLYRYKDTFTAKENGDVVIMTRSDGVIFSVTQSSFKHVYEPVEEVEGDGAKLVCAEILEIMREFHRQYDAHGDIDTPGGLEHMGDVWKLLRGWGKLLTTPPQAAKTEE